MIAQFGIAGDPALNREWMLSPATRLPDEPLRQKNKKGTLSFASQGKNTRTTQVRMRSRPRYLQEPKSGRWDASHGTTRR